MCPPSSRAACSTSCLIAFTYTAVFLSCTDAMVSCCMGIVASRLLITALPFLLCIMTAEYLCAACDGVEPFAGCKFAHCVLLCNCNQRRALLRFEPSPVGAMKHAGNLA